MGEVDTNFAFFALSPGAVGFFGPTCCCFDKYCDKAMLQAERFKKN